MSYNSSCLVSYPRSGNTLLRFLIEYITERVVIDDNKTIPDSAIGYYTKYTNSMDGLEIIPKNPPIMRKYHLIDKSLREKDLIKGAKVNFILRDYKDCISSHKFRSGVSSIESGVTDYCDLIKYYDGYENKGTLIYYDDLIDLEQQPILLKKLFDDNEIKEIPNWNKYLDNIEEINLMSKKGYVGIYKQPRYLIDDDASKYFTDLVKIQLGDYLFNRYLKRYE